MDVIAVPAVHHRDLFPHLDELLDGYHRPAFESGVPREPGVLSGSRVVALGADREGVVLDRTELEASGNAAS
ncbi:hypothetical protein [Janibacter hoylei]|uniref:hypothetical protein n=1 Tax=Janibacter hoylei TaxID=364298 RepID=UPI0024938EB5|nr:hypothetical protein [Janibacter hoylei]